MVRIGLIGAGTIGKIHAAALKELREVELFGIADGSVDSAKWLAECYRTKCYHTPAEMIADPKIDAVDICTPTPAHHQFTVMAAENKKHIFCEKPIARTVEDAKKSIEICKTNNVKFMVGHVLRYFPEYKQTRNLILNGSLGQVAVARLSRLNTFPRAWNDWYTDIEKSGGVVLDMIIHDFDFLRWCFGEAERVYAQGLAFKTMKEHIDYALVTIRFKNRVIAHIEGSWAEVEGFSAKFEIAGSKGVLQSDMKESVPLIVATRKTADSGAGVNIPESPLADNPYALELKDFIDCIINCKEPVIPGEEALKSLELALAVLESIRIGEVVKI